LIAAQIEAAFHKLSLLRSLAEFAGIKRDVRQYKLDLSYLVNDNNNIYGSIFGISGSKRFRTFDLEKMISALLKSLVFRGATIRKPDIMELSAKLMSQLLIGFPDGYLVCYSIQ